MPDLKNVLLGPIIGTDLIIGFVTAAALAEERSDVINTTNKTCLPLTEVNGVALGSDASAREHSLDFPGIIAISALPGADLRDSPQNLTILFRKNGVEADCFINHSIFPNSGTEFSLYVAGNRTEFDGKTRFGILDLQSNPEILRFAITEAKLAEAAHKIPQ